MQSNSYFIFGYGETVVSYHALKKKKNQTVDIEIMGLL